MPASAPHLPQIPAIRSPMGKGLYDGQQLPFIDIVVTLYRGEGCQEELNQLQLLCISLLEKDRPYSKCRSISLQDELLVKVGL